MTQDAPDTSRGDVAYWQLDHVQAARYHSRLSAMYALQSRRFADGCAIETRRCVIVLCVVTALVLLTKIISTVS